MSDQEKVRIAQDGLAPAAAMRLAAGAVSRVGLERLLPAPRWMVLLAAGLLGLAASACGDDPAERRPPAPSPSFEMGQVRQDPGRPGPGSGPVRAPAPAAGALPTWTPLAGGTGSEAAVPPAAVSPIVTSTVGVPPPPVDVAVPPDAPPGFTPPADIPQPTVRPALAVSAEGPPATDPEIMDLMRQVRASRLQSDVKRLVRFGTRHSLSATEDKRRGVGAARNWLVDAFSPASVGSGSQVVVQREAFALDFGGRVSGQENIMATLTGIGRRKRLIYVGAHYDSRVVDLADGEADAPGADDNASGVAGLLELARVLGARQWDASIRLVAFAAEEQGMHGSRHHAPGARDMGLPIEAMLNLDIIGGGSDAQGETVSDRLRVFSADPDGGPSRQLARHVAMMAQRYGPLSAEIVPRSDREGRESDHQPFAEAGFAAARLISASEDLSRQHDPSDTPERLDARYHADVVRLAVALTANLALAPAAPTDAPELALSADQPGFLSVTPPAVADARVAGHWIAWRLADEAAYRDWRWSAGEPLFIEGLPSGAGVAVAVAASDDAGHTSRFGPEASVTLP